MKKLLLSLAAGALIISCQNKEKEAESTEQTAPAVENVESTEAPAEETVSNTVTIEGNDQMKFNLSEIKVKAGEPVTLTLKHVGTQAKDVMGHNWILLKNGTDIATFATDAMKFKDNGYIPENADQMIAHTETIGGGEETTITFDAPEVGTYDFICSFPGHYGSMQGKFIVVE